MTPADALEKPRTAGEMLARSRDFLKRRGVAEARLEAELLVAHALGLTRLQLFMALDRPLAGAEIDRARDLLVRRGRREPLAYITGEREFYGRRFRVGRGVLIPRPETEGLVDRAREIARERSGTADPLRIADLGTGSGCIAITLALELAPASVLAVDVSPAAIECARANAAALGATLQIVLGDGIAVLDAAARADDRRFDLVVSNPPYVRVEESSELAPEVREHEPHQALFAPAGDGDYWVREILARARAWLAPGGRVLVELGRGQAERAETLARKGALESRVHRDLAGVPRVLEAW